jgi:hypothetical protein
LEVTSELAGESRLGRESVGIATLVYPGVKRDVLHEQPSSVEVALETGVRSSRDGWEQQS